MPIYQYRCENGHTFEAFQPMSDDALETCEVCAAAVVRVLSAPAVHFKGSGFYTTDYARKGERRAAEGGGSDSKESGSKDGGEASKPSEGSGSKSSEKASSGSKGE